MALPHAWQRAGLMAKVRVRCQSSVVDAVRSPVGRPAFKHVMRLYRRAQKWLSP